MTETCRIVALKYQDWAPLAETKRPLQNNGILLEQVRKLRHLFLEFYNSGKRHRRNIIKSLNRPQTLGFM